MLLHIAHWFAGLARREVSGGFARPAIKMATKVEEITGTDRDRLIYGNVLDAYGTEVFGENVSQSEEGEKMLNELADLSLKSFKGTITPAEKERMQELKKILPTEA